MKRLVLLGEGHGEVSALPVLTRKLLQEKGAGELLFVDRDVVRAHNASGLVKWDKHHDEPDYREWICYVRIAAHRSNLGGVLAVFDGDAERFPAGSPLPFCPATAAKSMAVAARDAGAGKRFSLAVTFACVEYETWIVAGVESLAGKHFNDGRPVLPAGISFPAGDPESHSKRWLQENCSGYRPTRDQAALTELLDLSVVRAKNLRSFARLENAVGQLVQATAQGSFVCTPC